MVVTNITGETHAYYRNGGRGDFDDVRLVAGLGAATRRTPVSARIGSIMTAMACSICSSQTGPSRSSKRCAAIRSRSVRRTSCSAISEAGAAGTHRRGSAFQRAEVGRGAAFGDIDNDGDVDVLVTNNNGPARVLLNEAGARAPRLQVRLQGVEDNRQGWGRASD